MLFEIMVYSVLKEQKQFTENLQYTVRNLVTYNALHMTP